MTALVYALIYLLALIPGLPLGFALFGKRHAAGWIAGSLLGYFLTSLSMWMPIGLGVPSAPTFVLAWAVMCAASVLLTRRRPAPFVTLPLWSPRDTRALVLLLALVAAITIPPFSKVGASDADGNRYYRAYFTADFVWHTALTAEMAKFSLPPRNPYLTARPVHYYWTYFLLPSAAAGAVLDHHVRVETCLKVNAIATALLFVSAIFLAAWTAIPRAWPVAMASALAIISSSAEGAFGLFRYWFRGTPLSEVRNLNIDALSNWWFGGLRVDGLQRCFWWVPQHSMAYALGLVALAIVNATGSAASLGAIGVAGLALAGSAAMNPFVGAIFSLAYGGAVLIDSLRSGDSLRRLARHAVAAAPVALAIFWCSATQMVEGAGGAVQLGWFGDARHAPVFTLFLSLGPALVPALVGGLVRLNPEGGVRPKPDAEIRLEPDTTGSVSRFAASALLALLSIALLYFVRLRVDASWVGFRAGQMFLVAVPALIARGSLATRAGRKLAAAVAISALVIGLPTTLIDIYNAQDISNFSESPVGPWTVTVTRDEREGLEWLRTQTPAGAVAQMDPTARKRETWSLIPSFAERRMAAGLPISLLDVPEYHVKSDRVRTMYQTTNVEEAWSTARALRINYLYVDRVERQAYPTGVIKFDTAPQYFAPVFRNREVSIYRVQ